VASTLLRFGRDPRHLGGAIGVTAVLHTWSQNLGQHVHVHRVVTGGALAPDGTRWIPARPTFLFPVRALAKVFRARYLAGLQRAFDRGALRCTDGLAALAAPTAFTAWLTSSATRRGSSTANRRLLEPSTCLPISGVTPTAWPSPTIGVDEFLRRFLLHIVPTRFVRIRPFGLLANRRRRAMLAQCRRLLAHQPPPPAPTESVRDLMFRLTGIDIERCPVCQHGLLRRLEVLPPVPTSWDTS